MSTAGVMSMNVPTASRMTLMISRMMIGLLLRPIIAVETACGMFSYDRTHDIPIDVAISSMTMAVVAPLRRRICGRSRVLTSLIDECENRA
jgi:hypothetical protein